MSKSAKEGSSFFASLKENMLAGAEAALGFAGVDASLNGVVGFLKDSVGAATALQSIMTQTNAVLASTKDVSGLTASGIRSLSDSLSSATGESDQAIQSAINLELTYTNISGKAIPNVTKTVMDMATAMNNGAIPSMGQLDATAKLVGRALNDPAKGMTMLTRDGITLSASQTALVKKLEASGNMAGAQGIIMDALKTKYGSAANAASNTFAGAVGKLSTVFDHLKEQIGGALIPVLGNLASAVSPLISDFAEAIPGAVAKVQGVFQLIGDHAPLVKGAIVAIGAGILSAFLPAILAAIPPLGVMAGEMIATATAAITLAAPFIAVGAATAALVGLVILLYNKWQPFRDAVDKGRAILQQVAAIIGNVLGNALKTVSTLFAQLQPKIAIVQSIVLQLAQGVGNVLGPVLNVVGGILGWLAGTVLKGIELEFQVLGAIVGWLASAVFQPVFSFFGTVLSDGLNAVKNFVTGAGNAFSGLGSLVHGVFTAVATGVEGGVNAIIDIINGLISAIDSIQINIPSIPLPGGGSIGGGSIGFSIGHLGHVSFGGIGGGGGGGGGGSSALAGAVSGLGSFSMPTFGGIGGAAAATAASGAGAGAGGGGGAPGSGGKHGGGAHHKGSGKHAAKGTGASSTIPTDILDIAQAGGGSIMAALAAHHGLSGSALANAIQPAIKSAAEAEAAKLGSPLGAADAIATKEANAAALAAGSSGTMTKAELKQAIKEGAQAGVTAASKAISGAVTTGVKAASGTASTGSAGHTYSASVPASLADWIQQQLASSITLHG